MDFLREMYGLPSLVKLYSAVSIECCLCGSQKKVTNVTEIELQVKEVPSALLCFLVRFVA